MEKIEFNTVELLSLYTTMALKRIVITNTSILEKLIDLAEVVENNLAQLKVEKKWFLATLRDHARLHHKDWSIMQGGEDVGIQRYNSLLLVLSLRIGLEKVWSPEGTLPFQEDLIQDLLPHLAPKLAITELNQKTLMFDFLSRYSPNLHTLLMPLSDNNCFKRCMEFKNLRVLELSGGVSDKVLCSSLWGIDKKSEKLLDLILKSKKECASVQLSLPHLEVLRSNMFQDTQNTMRISLGAVALALQPKMEMVESMQYWDTYDAVLHLLDMEAKHKSGASPERQLNVSHLMLKCREVKFDQVKQAVKACPKFSHLTLSSTGNMYSKLTQLLDSIPVKQVTKLDLEASPLQDMELLVLLSEMYNLKDLTLRVTPKDIVRFNFPSTYYGSDHTGLTDGFLLPDIKTLRLNFLPNNITEKEYSSNRILAFLSAFPKVEKLYLHNTLFAPPTFLVFGCIGGALAVLKYLKHLSVILCHEDLPRELASPTLLSVLSEHEFDNKLFVTHCNDVPNMLIDLQDEVTFKYLRGLTTLVIDEFYLHRYMDYMIESLRLAGVLVSVLYRPRVRRRNTRITIDKNVSLSDIEENRVEIVKKYVHVKKYKTVVR